MSPITGGPAGEWPTRPRVLDADPDTPTDDALADTDLLQAFSDAILDALCDSPVWENRHIGELEVQVCDDIAANALLPLVRAQVEAARRDALNEAADEFEAHQRALTRTGELHLWVEACDWLRDRAARGETRQP